MTMTSIGSSGSAVDQRCGDYDQGGAYWGKSNKPGRILYYFEGPVSDISGYVRAAGREDTKVKVREIHPLARFYR